MHSSQNILNNFPSYLYKNGFGYSSLDTSSVTIHSGQCRDSNNVMDISSNSDITININHKGINGLDTGNLVSNKTYGLCVIADSSESNTVQGIFFDQVNYVSPILPPGYDSYRIIGFFYINVLSAVEPYKIFGNFNEINFSFNTDISIFSGTATIDPQIISLVRVIPSLGSSNINAPVYPNRAFTESVISYVYVPSVAQNEGFITTDAYIHTIVGPVISRSVRGTFDYMIGDYTYQDMEPGMSLYVSSPGDTLSVSLSSYKFFV